MKRRLLVLATLTMLTTGVCTTAAVIHDRRLGLPEDELRGRVAAGTSEQATFELLRALAADPPTHAAVTDPSTFTVSQEYCAPRPFSLVDRGIPEGYHAIALRVANDGQWLPLMCTDRYIAYFLFDEHGQYYD